MRYAVVEDILGHEGAVVVGIHPQHREGQILGSPGQAFDHQRLAATLHRDAFCPPAGDVGEYQRVEVVAVGLGAVVVLDHVDLEEAGRRVAPVGERANRNAAADGGADAFAALALPVDLQARAGQHAINGGGADRQDLVLDDRVEVEMAMSLHGIDQHRH